MAGVVCPDVLANTSSAPEEPPAFGQTSLAEMYFVSAILVLLSLTGTAGNALVLYVFAQKKDKLVSTLCILVLAFVDFITCLVVIPYTIYMENVNFRVSLDAVCKVYQFLITSNIPFSALIMTAIAVDRYFCICHPFLQAMTLARAKAMIAALGLLAAGLGICVSLMYGVYRVPAPPVLPCNNGTNASAVTASPRYDAIRELSTRMTETPEVIEDLVADTNADAGNLVEYTGECAPNELVFSNTFQLTFQKLYYVLFIVCLAIVIFLYVLIYRSVLDRRTRRQNQKSKSLSLVVAEKSVVKVENCTEETLITTVETENGVTNGGRPTTKLKNQGGPSGEKKTSISSTKRDMLRMANLKTAAMLFVVTVVFIVTYIPAFLMALGLVPYNMTVFYMYFANNVANPVIYSFMNKNFREDTKRLLCR